jgi:hypothetical protein
MLGTRQLLGGFFVIVLLLGVVFARGYSAGRNSTPSPRVRQSLPSRPLGVTGPHPGTYWQVMAVGKPQAEAFARVLRDKGFSVSLTPGTKSLTRVLVGPYPDRESLGRAKSDLVGSGFHPVILKRE